MVLKLRIIITYFHLVQPWNSTLNTRNKNIKPVNITIFYDLYKQTPLKYGFHCIYQNANNEYYALNCKNVTNITRYDANLLILN